MDQASLHKLEQIINTAAGSMAVEENRCGIITATTAIIIIIIDFDDVMLVTGCCCSFACVFIFKFQN